MKQLFGTSSNYWQQVGVLGALLALFSALFGFLALYQKPRKNLHQKAWCQLERILASKGFERQVGEGPKDFARRVQVEDPILGAKAISVVDRYIQSAYSDNQSLDTTTFDNLIKMIKQL